MLNVAYLSTDVELFVLPVLAFFVCCLMYHACGSERRETRRIR